MLLARLAPIVALLCAVSLAPAGAQDLLTKKQTFEIAELRTQGGATLKQVKVGWESWGTLNADKSNAILICHFFSGSSHAAGKYAAADKVPGYWDAIIGPGKAIDTDKYFVLSADTLVNLGAGDQNVVTTGPASVDPATGKPYGMTFPIVTIGDFVEVQRRLLDSLGIGRLAMVAGASMGALQTYTWAAAHPDRVARIMAVVGAAEADANLVEWLDIWASPIRLDPRWNGGDYYGREAPTAGLAQALKIVTLHAQHRDWANATFGLKWAKEGADPAAGFANRFAIEQALDGAGAARAGTSDANHFLYLVKANQIFTLPGGSLAEGAKRMKAPALIVSSPKDLVFPPEAIKATVDALTAAGVPVRHLTLEGTRGHLDGVLSMKQAEGAIREHLAK